MNRAGRIIAVCGLSMALMMPQIAYAAETLSVQVSERTGLTTVGNKQSAYDNVAISHVSNYVNIRSEANTSSSIVGNTRQQLRSNDLSYSGRRRRNLVSDQVR